jgi:hypothetical protein
MTLVNTLQSSGITLGMVQLAIIAGIVVYIIGTYWKVLLTGAAVILVAVILLYPDSNSKDPVVESPPVINNQPVVPPVVNPTNPTIESKSSNAPIAFMNDCMKDAEYTKEECESLWRND